MAKGRQKLRAVQEAIGELFNDTTVSAEQTLEYLEELEADVEGKIDAIKADLERRARKSGRASQ